MYTKIYKFHNIRLGKDIRLKMVLEWLSNLCTYSIVEYSTYESRKDIEKIFSYMIHVKGKNRA